MYLRELSYEIAFSFKTGTFNLIQSKFPFLEKFIKKSYSQPLALMSSERYTTMYPFYHVMEQISGNATKKTAKKNSPKKT